MSICCTPLLYTSVPWLFATLTDLVVGGWLVDALVQRGWNSVRVRQVVLIGGTRFGLGIFGATRSSRRWSGLLDQHFHRRIVRGVAGRLVDPFADCSEGKRRHGGRHFEFQQSARRHCRADRHRLRRAVTHSFCVGVRRGDGILLISIAAIFFCLGEWSRSLNLRKPALLRGAHRETHKLEACATVIPG